MGFIRFCDKKDQSEDYESVCLNRDIWAQARNLIHKNKLRFLNVVNDSNELIGYCFEDNAINEHITRSLQMLEQCTSLPVSLDYLYKDVKIVWIHGCNEYAFRLVQILKEQQLNYFLVGPEWEYLEEHSTADVYDYKDSEIYHVYADGTDYIKEECYGSYEIYPTVINCFTVFADIVMANCMYYHDEHIRRIIVSGIQTRLVLVPEIDEVSYRTKCETIAIDNTVNYSSDRNDFNKKILSDIYSPEEVQYFYSNGEAFDKVHEYENKDVADSTIYLIGPGIVKGYGVFDDHSLKSNLEMQNNIRSDRKCTVIPISTISNDFEAINQALSNIHPQERDCVVFIDRKEFWKDTTIEYLESEGKLVNTLSIYNMPGRETMFCDCPIHTNNYGNRLIAQAICDSLLKED